MEGGTGRVPLGGCALLRGHAVRRGGQSAMLAPSAQDAEPRSAAAAAANRRGSFLRVES